MKIKGSEFLIGAVKPEQYPTTGWPEIALCGRSNVGKSSLINRLINRKNLARTSGRPGKTQELNYYAINSEPRPFYFVDLPGYGFAQASRIAREKWGQFIEAYLKDRELAMVWQVIDLRHKPSMDDIRMHDWLSYYNKPIAIVATKADKVSKGQWNAHKDIIQKTLNTKSHIYVFSAQTGYGEDCLKELIETLL